MTPWQKFAGALASSVLAGTIVLYATAPSLAEMTATQRAQKVALVEEVKGKVTGVELMDYVALRTVIKLGPKDSIVLTYMTSCWRETITGGTVVVGTEQSMGYQSDIQRVKVDCDRGGRPVTDQQGEVAASVFRGVFTPSGAR